MGFDPITPRNLLPVPGVGDAGKIVKVNAGHDGYELDVDNARPQFALIGWILTLPADYWFAQIPILEGINRLTLTTSPWPLGAGGYFEPALSYPMLQFTGGTLQRGGARFRVINMAGTQRLTGIDFAVPMIDPATNGDYFTFGATESVVGADLSIGNSGAGDNITSAAGGLFVASLDLDLIATGLT